MIQPTDEQVKQYVQDSACEEDNSMTRVAMAIAFKEGYRQGFVDGVSAMEATLYSMPSTWKPLKI